MRAPSGPWRARGLAALAGLLLACSLPPLGLWWLTFGALVILGAVLPHERPREGFLRGWLTGSVASGMVGLWLLDLVPRFTNLPKALGVLLWLLAALFMGLGLALAGLLASLTRKVLPTPVALGASLWAAERFGPQLFPYPLALTLVDAPYLAQSGDVLGVNGLGAVLLGCAGAFALGARERRWTRGCSAAACVALALVAYGFVRERAVRRAMARSARWSVALVQPSVPATLRWEDSMRVPILRHLQQLTEDARKAPTDLVVWHEGAYPYPLAFRAGRDGQEYPAALQGPGAPWLVFGAAALGADGWLRNAAFVRSPDGALAEPVAKRELIPFGERIPLLGGIPWVRDAFSRALGMTAGDRPELLPVRGLTVGILNCFEDTVPRSGAEVARADLLVNITNSAWFDGPGGPGEPPPDGVWFLSWRNAAGRQHLVQARWRAIEARRDLVRAVNTGPSAHVNALGEVERRSFPTHPWVLRVSPRVGLGLSPVAPGVVLWGPWASALVLAGALAERLRRRLRAR
ncbi:MAG: apolipoprotein N-acyltransferase [Deltaproteobacteria bacterium]|nr:apolipoprotein N-acyltransferase [Deltaproteobacteria bacterium]